MNLREQIARSFDVREWDKDERVLTNPESSMMQRVYVELRRKTFLERADGAVVVLAEMGLINLLKFWWGARK